MPQWIEGKTGFRLVVTGYDWDMVRPPTNADVIRLQQFLKALEADAEIKLGDIDLRAHEIAKLKREILYLESVVNGAPSKAYLFQIAIDYGASQGARNSA
jgi:hypothetical protein